jgi:hypothetical protein
VARWGPHLRVGSCRASALISRGTVSSALAVIDLSPQAHLHVIFTLYRLSLRSSSMIARALRRGTAAGCAQWRCGTHRRAPSRAWTGRPSTSRMSTPESIAPTGCAIWTAVPTCQPRRLLLPMAPLRPSRRPRGPHLHRPPLQCRRRHPSSYPPRPRPRLPPRPCPPPPGHENEVLPHGTQVDALAGHRAVRRAERLTAPRFWQGRSDQQRRGAVSHVCHRCTKGGEA